MFVYVLGVRGVGRGVSFVVVAAISSSPLAASGRVVMVVAAIARIFSAAQTIMTCGGGAG